MMMTDSDYQSDGMHFACTFESGNISGAYWITVVSSPLSPEGKGRVRGSAWMDSLTNSRVTVWHLTSGFAEATRALIPAK